MTKQPTKREAALALLRAGRLNPERRRRQTTALLRRGRRLALRERVKALHQVNSLAADLGARIVYDDEFEPSSYPYFGVVFAPPLETDTAYVAALHELGHVATTDVDEPVFVSRPVIEAETSAWEWALPRVAVEVSDGAWFAALRFFSTYVRSRADAAAALRVGGRIVDEYRAAIAAKEAA